MRELARAIGARRAAFARVLFYEALCIPALVCACATDTSGLARREPRQGESAGAAGAGTTLPDPESGDGGSGQGGSAPSAVDSGARGVIAMVHGIVDGGRLFVCLWETTTSRTLRSERPIPEGGLAFGEVYRLPTDWDLASQEMAADLFMAVPEELRELGCEQLSRLPLDSSAGPAPDAGSELGDAGGGAPGVPFPVEPALPRRAGSVTFPIGGLRPGGAYALVSAGCATRGVLPPEELCGVRDSLFGGYQGLVLAEFGAGAPTSADGSLGLQFLNASRAVARADLVLQGSNQRQPLTLANDVRFGALRPLVPARVAVPVGLELHVDGATSSTYTQAWAETGGAADASVGRDHLVVYVGPAPSVASDSGFAPPRFVLIPSSE